MNRKLLFPAGLTLAVLLLLIGVIGKYAPLPIPTPPGVISQLVVIAETKDRTPEFASVLFGKTARAAREAGKWKLADKDHVSPALKPLIEQAPPTVLPWLIIDSEGVVSWSGKLPETEAAFSKLVDSKGGL